MNWNDGTGCTTGIVKQTPTKPDRKRKRKAHAPEPSESASKSLRQISDDELYKAFKNSYDSKPNNSLDSLDEGKRNTECEIIDQIENVWLCY